MIEALLFGRDSIEAQVAAWIVLLRLCLWLWLGYERSRTAVTAQRQIRNEIRGHGTKGG
jgi:hypothetical protein